MNNKEMVEITEYTPTKIDSQLLSEINGQVLWESFSKEINVDFPSPKTNYNWQLTSKGWIGYIPLDLNTFLYIKPRVKISNLYKMLEYAYRLKSFKSLDGLIECNYLNEFYERIANILALKIIQRYRKGLYKSYENKLSQLKFIKGKLDMNKLTCNPNNYDKLYCSYKEQTFNNIDNQILYWTLHLILRTKLCSFNSISNIKKAYQLFHGIVDLIPCNSEMLKKQYNKLNQDYFTLHSLCRFFIDQKSPSNNIGNYHSLPFLVNTPRLFELFVSEWLKANLPLGYKLNYQDNVRFSTSHNLKANIDIVIYESKTNKVKYVIDTKYKIDPVENNDVYQITTYALAKDCNNAVLIYPTSLNNNFEVNFRGITIKCLSFDLNKDIEQSGKELINQLFPECDNA